MNKDVLTQAEVLVALGMTGPRDVAAIDEWVRLHADEAEARQVKQTLAALPVGTAWVWSPEWLGVLRQVAIRRRRTFDSSATPKVGQVVLTPVQRPSLDLSALAALIEETDDSQEIDARAAQRRLEAERTAHAATRLQLQRAAADLADARQQLLEPRAPAWLEPELLRLLDRVHAAETPLRAGSLEPRSEPVVVAPPTVAARPASDVEGGMRLPKAQRAILSVLAQHGTQTVQQVALLVGYDASGGGFNNALGALRTAACVTGPKTALQITETGRTALGPIESLPSGPALIDYWTGRVGKAERLILTALIDSWPDALDRHHLAAATGYAATSGGFNNALGRLRSLELISGDRTGRMADPSLGSARDQAAQHA
ncbi:hypothetical protein [uncultured Amnibacterium sp.]|uniref:hypothetical protein n=1 Tax=uncultured Amnibacterium sp. TaxID=1631851 RepID=UPI0035C9C56A